MSKIEFEESSGNIFADLGLENAEEMQTKGLIGCHVVELLSQKSMTQKELGKMLGVKQAEVSHLMNAHFDRFTSDKLMEFVRKLNYKINIEITPHFDGEPYQQVAFG